MYISKNVTTGKIDKDKVEEAIRMLLEAIGENPDREGLRATPSRIARMYEEKRIARGLVLNDEAIKAEILDYVDDYKEMLACRKEEKEKCGIDSYGKKGLLYRLSSMSKDINAIIMAYPNYITIYQKTKMVIELIQLKNETEELIKEIL